MAARLTLVLGGVSSGKSEFAEKLMHDSGLPKTYVATAQSHDAEMDAKIKAHIARRDNQWTNLEAPLDIPQALATAGQNTSVLIDCASMYLTNHMMAESNLETAFATIETAIDNSPSEIVVVSNEVGLGGIAENKLARKFQKHQGEWNQRLAAMADSVFLVIAGQPIVLKAPQ